MPADTYQRVPLEGYLLILKATKTNDDGTVTTYERPTPSRGGAPGL
ncbi:hypothetical protein FHX15_006066 [Rhizobium sp. BK650]|nr:hypothetical protein [Rhizobium sp. BK650]